MKPTDADTRATYTLNSDGSVTVEAGWKYYAIAFVLFIAGKIKIFV